MQMLYAENFTLHKFHTVKDWYQFPTAREKLIPIRQVFQTCEKCACSEIISSIHVYS